MTNAEMRRIGALQREGLGYRRIAALMDLPINTVKSYCQRHPVITACPAVAGCKNCGADLGENAERYKKQFCSDSCRMAWWNQHRYLVRRKAERQAICAYCGRAFSVYARPTQRFCSRECYHQYRKQVAE